jgi:hypothetical protein
MPGLGGHPVGDGCPPCRLRSRCVPPPHNGEIRLPRLVPTVHDSGHDSTGNLVFAVRPAARSLASARNHRAASANLAAAYA